jgi:prepilin-type N-terminal cleavage/methylation domain-containing protein
MKLQKQAFTLVELIVVITILAILGTIAFISMQSYSKTARDSVRVADIKNIETSLELFSLDSWKYPLPDDNEIVSYSWETLWYQWTVWETVVTNLSRNFNKIPLDPLYEREYIYSVTYLRNEYEILWMYEWDFALNNSVFNQTFAANITPKIKWQYNGLFVKSQSYIVPVPSIITAEEISTWLWLDLIQSNVSSLVIDNGDNHPKIWLIQAQTGALDITLVSTWVIDSRITDNEKIAVMKLIQSAYTWSILANEWIYKTLLTTPDEDLDTLADYVLFKDASALASLTQSESQSNALPTNSLRFNDNDSAYLSRTPTVAGDRTKWTWAWWVKFWDISTDSTIFHAWNTDVNRSALFIQWTTNQLVFWIRNSSSWVHLRQTNAVYRDPSAWYHIVLVFNSNNLLADDKTKIYVNGVNQSFISTATTIGDGVWWQINNTDIHNIAQNTLWPWSTNFDWYLSDVHFIDWQALDPTSFGSFNSYGQWVPKTVSISDYGTNGFNLAFWSGSNLWLDTSWKSNDWLTNNIDSTDQVLDTPSNNYATLNPIDTQFGTVWTSNMALLSDGNLTAVPSANNNGVRSTFGITSGKWYWEVDVVTGTVSNNAMVWITYNGWQSLYDYGVAYTAGGDKFVNSVTSAYGTSTTSGDTIGIALDADNNEVTFYKNNSSQWTISYTPIEDTVFPAYWSGGSVSAKHTFNFGQSGFTYTPPTWFKALSTVNLPIPSINPSDYFNTVTYTGNWTAQSITDVGFQPDLLWIKSRDWTANSHKIFDSVRWVNKQLASDWTFEESSSANQMSSFDTGGFSLLDWSANENGTSFVAWNWKESAAAGFDIVSYTWDWTANQTINHNLWVKPWFMMVKERSWVGSWDDWVTYHKSLGNDFTIRMNLTEAKFSGYLSSPWADTDPTSTVFSVSNEAWAWVNGNWDTFIAYLFAEKEWYSKIWSYTGNASINGPFIHTGFKPAYILMKRVNGLWDWIIFDNDRDISNVLENNLIVNSSGIESVNFNYNTDFISNGFKIRWTSAGVNASWETYIYIAFAESPFKYSTAR